MLDARFAACGPLRPAIVGLGCAALEAVLEFSHPADAVLRRFFRAHARLGRRDRGFIAETVFAVLRRLRRYQRLAGTNKPRRLFLLAAAALPPAERRDLRSALDPSETGWLSSALDAPADALSVGERAELPDWLVERLRRHLNDDEIIALGESMQESAPLDLRVNTLLAARDEVLTRLRADGFDAAPTRYSPLGVRLAGKPALEQHPLYLDGRIEVQDEGSQLLGLLLAPVRRELVVDFCAGAGGKTLLLGALMRSTGRLYAFDLSEQRLARLRARMGRAGLSNVHPERIEHERDPRLKRLAGKADRVLVDAPCTGLGTLRRNPDLKWRHNTRALDELRAKQASILDAAASLVKPGGRLVYATCSILPEENEDIAGGFLATHTDFHTLDCSNLLSSQGITLDTGAMLNLRPERHGTDGFFAAVFERSEIE